MGRKNKKRSMPNPFCTSQRYWNKVLKDRGLGVKLRPLPKKRIGKPRKAA